MRGGIRPTGLLKRMPCNDFVAGHPLFLRQGWDNCSVDDDGAHPFRYRGFQPASDRAARACGNS
jgi:hypothetical protein